MTPNDQLRAEWVAWTRVCAAVEDRDVTRGQRPADPDDIVTDSPLLAACVAARDVVERIVYAGGHWQGRWIPAPRYGSSTRRRA